MQACPMCGTMLETGAASACERCPMHSFSAGCSLDLVPCPNCGYHALPEELVRADGESPPEVPLVCGGEGSAPTQSLAQLSAGSTGRIAWVECGDAAVNRRLLAYGLAPGARIEVLHRRPALVLRIYETELAIAPEVAEGIAVAVPTPAAQRA